VTAKRQDLENNFMQRPRDCFQGGWYDVREHWSFRMFQNQLLSQTWCFFLIFFWQLAVC